MKNKIFYFLTLILITTLSGCEESAEPTGIDFITFGTSTETYVLNQGTTLNAEYKIFTATNVSSDITLDLNVTTNIDAANYSVPSSITIPANSNEASFSISINENNFDKINGETMSISFSSPDGFYAGATNLDIKVNVFCPSAIAGNYKYSDGNQKNVTISADAGINNFVVSGDNAFNSNYFININDQCGTISVTGGQLTGFGIAIAGSGTVLANGNIVMTYSADGYFTDRTMTFVKQ
tara:strand:+ start:1555 stop:2268 length:714 start_codon:yes stop_codon:yes gene_type:complete